MKRLVGRGIVAGIIGVIAINIVEFFLDLLGISETTLWEAGGLFFLTPQAVATPLGIAIGVMTHVFMAIVFGTLISYYIHYSGTDFAIVKGITISLVGLFLTLGIVFPLRGLAPEMQGSPGDTLSAFIDHIVFGALAGYIVKYIHERERNKQEA